MLRVVLVVMWASCVFPPPVESIKVLYVQACQGSDSTVLVSSTVSHNYSDAFLVLLNCSACRCDPPYVSDQRMYILYSRDIYRFRFPHGWLNAIKGRYLGSPRDISTAIYLICALASIDLLPFRDDASF